MNKINALEKSGPETTKTLLDNFDGKVKHLKDSTEDKLSGIESVINKNSEAINIKHHRLRYTVSILIHLFPTMQLSTVKLVLWKQKQMIS